LGHISLSVPVYAPPLFTTLYKLLRLKCFACHGLRIAASRSRLVKIQLMLLDLGRLDEALSVEKRVREASTAAAASVNAGILAAPVAEEFGAEVEGEAPAKGKGAKKVKSKKGNSTAEVDARLAAEEAVLQQMETDCLVAGGSDVGCGFSPHHTGMGVHHRYSQHVREQREKIISEYLSSFPAKTCHNCQAIAIPIKKDGYAKLFSKPLPKKALSNMAASGIRYVSATAALRQKRAAAGDKMATDDADDAFDGVDEDGGGEDEGNTRQRYMPVSEVSAHLELLWDKDYEILRRIYMPTRGNVNKRIKLASATLTSATAAKKEGWKLFFMRVIPVPPPRFRPPQILGEAQYEHAQNIYLTKIIRDSDALVELGLATAEDASRSFAGVDMKKAIATWMDLQNCVNGFMDSTKASTTKGAAPPNGIRQLLEKKEGMFRKNMMGKRVNFAARSVISPDPYLRADQVGVPVRFAKTLTFKQPVTHFNVKLMRQLVINGPYEWPGATHIENEDGSLIDLSTRTKVQREALAKTLMTPSQNFAMSTVLTGGVGLTDTDRQAAIAAATSGLPSGMGVKRVYRHLQDDDIVLMNRQPTLHKPSIMAHRARVLRHWSSQQCIRFHYANCKTYNADFDGDEMNMHLPQDEISRAEAYTIVATPYQYLAPTSGAPLRGLIQDHNSVSVILTKRDTLLTRDQYCQLVFSALQALPQYGFGNGISGGDGAFGIDTQSLAGTQDIIMLPPAIFKPRPYWTGKQVISTILHALSSHLPPNARQLQLDTKSKIAEGLWGQAAGRKDVIGVGDNAITIRGNDMVTGVIDKNSLGNTSYGLVHAVYETYGPNAAGALLSATGRLLTVYLQWVAMTCGMDDLVLNPSADASRAALIHQALEGGALASAKFAGINEEPGQFKNKQPSWVHEVRLAVRAKLKGGTAGSDATGAAAAQVINELDGALKSSVAKFHSKMLDACLPYGLYKPFPYNQFSLMVSSGAKGSSINHAMIAVGLGQQELEVSLSSSSLCA
jgi:DNA-directed RNA polymerase I subunit RPA1